MLGAVVSDPDGALIESSGNVDPEGTAAVLAYTSQALAQAGEQLGLGTLSRAVISSATKACVLSVLADGVLGVYLDPSKPVAAFEKKLDELLQR